MAGEIKNILGALSPVEKLEFVIELGKELPPIPAGAHGDEISGCASRVEIFRDSDNNFYADADSGMVRGLVMILLSMVQGKTASEISKMDLAGDFSDLELNLGAGRLNGIQSMIQYLKGL